MKYNGIKKLLEDTISYSHVDGSLRMKHQYNKMYKYSCFSDYNGKILSIKEMHKIANKLEEKEIKDYSIFTSIQSRYNNYRSMTEWKVCFGDDYPESIFPNCSSSGMKIHIREAELHDSLIYIEYDLKEKYNMIREAILICRNMLKFNVLLLCNLMDLKDINSLFEKIEKETLTEYEYFSHRLIKDYKGII